jgi:hypothetical protein
LKPESFTALPKSYVLYDKAAPKPTVPFGMKVDVEMPILRVNGSVSSVFFDFLAAKALNEMHAVNMINRIFFIVIFFIG